MRVFTKRIWKVIVHFLFVDTIEVNNTPAITQNMKDGIGTSLKIKPREATIL